VVATREIVLEDAFTGRGDGRIEGARYRVNPISRIEHTRVPAIFLRRMIALG